jgi:hypothetical protein
MKREVASQEEKNPEASCLNGGVECYVPGNNGRLADMTEAFHKA